MKPLKIPKSHVNAETLIQLLRISRRFDDYARRFGSDQCVMKIVSLSRAYVSNEGDKTFRYPETVEIKFQNWSNHFYSLRTKDLRWIPEGAKLNGKGLSTFQVMRLMAKELKAFYVHKNPPKPKASNVLSFR